MPSLPIPLWQPHPADVLEEYDDNTTPEASIVEIRVLAKGSKQESIRIQELRKQVLEDGEY